MIRAGALTTYLKGLLGDEGLVRFAQAFGGTRVYVPFKLADDHEIVTALGRELADKLSRRMAPATIRVPLARREIALWHRDVEKLSNAAIARKLRITETGVEKLFGREDLPDQRRGSSNPAQMDLL
jgi:DNA-binding NarL/FixJ family response regulator